MRKKWGNIFVLFFVRLLKSWEDFEIKYIYLQLQTSSIRRLSVECCFQMDVTRKFSHFLSLLLSSRIFEPFTSSRVWKPSREFDWANWMSVRAQPFVHSMLHVVYGEWNAYSTSIDAFSIIYECYDNVQFSQHDSEAISARDVMLLDELEELTNFSTLGTFISRAFASFRSNICR